MFTGFSKVLPNWNLVPGSATAVRPALLLCFDGLAISVSGIFLHFARAMFGKTLRDTMKFLLLIAVFFAGLWLWRKECSTRADGAPPRAPERMVTCSYCGVNQPVSESILIKGLYYCCAEHRQQAESSGR